MLAERHETGGATMQYLWIAVGSGVGGWLRVAITDWAAGLGGGVFPWGTIAVNLLGSLLIGLAAALVGADGRPFAYSPAGQFLMTGVLGGFTTFSAFSIQTLGLLQQGDWGAAFLNVFFSVTVGLALAAVGFALGTALSRGGAL
jgi:fluoride exporter